MTAWNRSVLTGSLLAAVSFAGCTEHGVDPNRYGSIAVVAQLPAPVNVAGVEGEHPAPAEPWDALNHLDSAFAIITGPTTATQKLAGPSPGFTGTIGQLRTGSYTVVVTGYEANLLHYHARSTNVAVNENATSTVAPTFAILIAAGLTANSVSGTQINLTWRDSAVSEEGFRIERCQGPGCSNFAEIGTAPANATTFSSTGLTSGTSFSYRVRAFIGATNGAFSNVATATAGGPSISLSPTTANFTAAQGGGNPAPQTVNVTNGGAGTLPGLAVGTITYGAGASGWLGANLSSTTAPSTLTLTPTTGSLAPGTYTATVPVTSASAGNSPQNVSVTFTVNAAPDLRITSFSVAGSPSPPAAGDPISVTLIRQNQGSAASGPFRFGVYFSTDATVNTSDALSGIIGNVTTQSAGSSITSTFLTFVPASLAPGVYFVAAIIDDLGAVAESDETNNVSSTVSVTVPPSLIANGSFSGGTASWFGSGTNVFVFTTGSNSFSAIGHAALATDASGVGVLSATGALFQDVTIPAGATNANLTFWFNILSQESTTTTQFDVLTFTIRNTSNTILTTLGTVSNLDKTTATGYPNYTQRSFNLNSFIGQTVRIHFEYTTDGSLPSEFRLDNINVTRN